jgi:hypothetical protein
LKTNQAGSVDAGIVRPSSALDRPRRTPEELADLVTRLPKREQAEQIYELVLYAARAVEENDLHPLAGFLAELEDIAEVNADPERRLALEEEVESVAASDPSLELVDLVGVAADPNA